MSDNQFQWTFTKDGMPEINACVLFCPRGGIYCEDGRFDGEDWITERTDSYDDFIVYSEKSVYAWMYLPTPPQEPQSPPTP